MTIGAAAIVTANATRTAGSGGDISLTSSGEVVVDGDLTANGRNGNVDDGGGDGGSIAITGSVVRAERAANRIAGIAGGPDGIGGEIELTSEVGALSVRAGSTPPRPAWRAPAAPSASDAAGALQLLGPIDVSGGSDGGGGDIDVAGAAAVTIAPAATLNAAANSAARAARSTWRRHARGAGRPHRRRRQRPGSIGGSVLLTACDLQIAATAHVSSLRSNGDNT